MTEVKPFQVHIPQSQLDDLQTRLHAARFPPTATDLTSSEAASSSWSDGDWSRGPPTSAVRHLIEYWKGGYDWRATEAKLNSYPQFTTTITVSTPIELHFLHYRSGKPGAIPVLFVHGWPGSFLESLKIIDLLREADGGTTANSTSGKKSKGGDSHPVFDLIVPSLPNFGFSSGATTPGFGLDEYATVLNELMVTVLGYDQYVTQAGDWGFWITRALGHMFPKHVRASHYNMVYTAEPRLKTTPGLAIRERLLPRSWRRTAADRATEQRTQWFRKWSQAYNALQSTRPGTLGLALADSPVALLAWIYEKMHDWSDGYPWTEEEVVTWVSMYWFAKAGPNAAQHIYYEVTHEEDSRYTYWSMLEKTSPNVKLGLTFNPRELENFPQAWGKTLGNVVFETVNPHGGHFYAHEHPDWLLRDLQRMFGRGGPAEKVVEGRHGYSLAGNGS